MDLCSVSNISLLIMDENFHGYYIHGQAPGLRADLTLSDLKKLLDKEKEGFLRDRTIDNGRLPNMIQGQAITGFEIYFPAQIR